MDGRYKIDYFNRVIDQDFSHTSPASIHRLRAVVQYMNEGFVKKVRTIGHKYHLNHLKILVLVSRIPLKIFRLTENLLPSQSLVPRNLLC